MEEELLAEIKDYICKLYYELLIDDWRKRCDDHRSVSPDEYKFLYLFEIKILFTPMVYYVESTYRLEGKWFNSDPRIKGRRIDSKYERNGLYTHIKDDFNTEYFTSCGIEDGDIYTRSESEDFDKYQNPEKYFPDDFF